MKSLRCSLISLRPNESVRYEFPVRRREEKKVADGFAETLNSRTMMWQHVSMVLIDKVISQPYVRVFSIGQIKSIDIDPPGTVE